MNKKFIIQKNKDIEVVIKNGSKKINKIFVLYYAPNNLNYNRYCISVSKKIGKAYLRNYVKRRIKDILMKNNINNSNDYVIIVRNSILNLDYSIIKKELLDLMEGEK